LWARDLKEWNQEGTPRRILPFLGFCVDDSGYYFVSPCQLNGTAKEYLLAHPNTDRLKLIRGIAEGLLMLHTMNPPVVHGGLNASSVIIDDWGNPLLSDFGIAKFIDDVQGSASFSLTGMDDSVRWHAPEVNAERELSTRSDIYSLGMTILELITGKWPWDNVQYLSQVILKVANNSLQPDRPPEMQSDALWELVCRCRTFDQHARPSISEVSADLELI